MSQENPNVLYVGSVDTGRWLAGLLEPYGGYVYLPTGLIQALGMYVSYVPNLVVLDANAVPDLARQVYFHLRTINAKPILMLDWVDGGWKQPTNARVRVLNTPPSQTELLAIMGRLIGTSFLVSEGV